MKQRSDVRQAAQDSARQPGLSSSHGRPASSNVVDAAGLTPALEVNVEWSGPHGAVATLGDCALVVVSDSAAGVALVDAIEHGLAGLAARFQQFGYVSYIDGDRCARMDPEARSRMGPVLERHSARIGAAALVMDGKGFNVAIMRSVATSIHWMSRARHPMRVFASVSPALTWYEAQRPGCLVDAPTLRGALLSLCPAQALGAFDDSRPR